TDLKTRVLDVWDKNGAHLEDMDAWFLGKSHVVGTSAFQESGRLAAGGGGRWKTGRCCTGSIEKQGRRF
ncbi:MAG: hypothetical protein VX189_00995, partial [Planctomycetota bacterium]|nr:hypothetical protein [Planctomycetota bacterium]